MTSIGFTGTRIGMTPAQYRSFAAWLMAATEPGDEFHHGDCVGADAGAAVHADQCGLKMHSHPGTNNHGASPERAFTRADVLYPHAPYLIRNQQIVGAADVLLATPGGPETRRSGTWSTIRYAVDTNLCVVFIVYPDGSIRLRYDDHDEPVRHDGFSAAWLRWKKNRVEA